MVFPADTPILERLAKWRGLVSLADLVILNMGYMLLAQLLQLEAALQDIEDPIEAYNRGLEYLDYNEPDHAIAAFSQAIALNGRHALAHFARGFAYASMGELERLLPTTMRPSGSIPRMRPPISTAAWPCGIAARRPRPRPISPTPCS